MVSLPLTLIDVTSSVKIPVSKDSPVVMIESTLSYDDIQWCVAAGSTHVSHSVDACIQLLCVHTPWQFWFFTNLWWVMGYLFKEKNWHHYISCGNHALYPLFEVCTTLLLVFCYQDSATMIVDYHDYSGPVQPPRPPRPWPDYFFSTWSFLRVRNCTWHFELRTCRCVQDIMVLSKQVSVIYPVISAKPHQPVSFEFPKRDFGSRWLWKAVSQPGLRSGLGYTTAKCSAIYTCVKAFKELKMPVRNVEDAFVTWGFHNWKLATTSLCLLGMLWVSTHSAL